MVTMELVQNEIDIVAYITITKILCSPHEQRLVQQLRYMDKNITKSCYPSGKNHLEIIMDHLLPSTVNMMNLRGPDSRRYLIYYILGYLQLVTWIVEYESEFPVLSPVWNLSTFMNE